MNRILSLVLVGLFLTVGMASHACAGGLGKLLSVLVSGAMKSTPAVTSTGAKAVPAFTKTAVTVAPAVGRTAAGAGRTARTATTGVTQSASPDIGSHVAAGVLMNTMRNDRDKDKRYPLQ
ncbi:MAG: hypothetical protein HY914_07645 [Desulfomonile tiedjei]|nr:hypothetical protein [Desulfomonile tiedjei]